MSIIKEKKIVPVYTVHWTRVGELDTPPYVVKTKGGVLEALVWFHLEQQLRAGLSPELYSVQQITAAVDGSATGQRWAQDELPASNVLSKVTLTKPMAKRYEAELAAFAREGGFYSVA